MEIEITLFTCKLDTNFQQGNESHARIKDEDTKMYMYVIFLM